MSQKSAVEFGVGNATITDWVKNCTKVKQFYASSNTKCFEKQHTSKLSKFEQTDNALFIWFTQKREKGTPLSVPLLKEKLFIINFL